MNQHTRTSGRSRLFVASLSTFAAVAFSTSASAQSLVSQNGVVVATDGDPVPDANGIPIPGFTFNGVSANCVLDEHGNILFLGQFQSTGTPLTAIDNKAYFYGSSRSTLKQVVRGGDQAPGLPAGVLLRTTSGSSSGLGATPCISPDGRMWWSSNLYDGGVTVDSTNDTAIFGGLLGAQTVYVRKGDVAPGTGGATFAQAFSVVQQSNGVNRNGRIFFQASLVNGTGVPAVTTVAGMNNQAGIWTGLPGALELVARKSSPVSGLGGAVAIDTSATIGSLMQENDAGHLFYDVVLSTTQGSPAATAGTDHAFMVFTPGAGSQKLVREGDDAPGTFDPSSGTFATFNALTGDAWTIGQGVTSWTRNDQTIFASTLRGGDTVTGVNDRALFKGGVGTLAMIQRRGDPAPGTDAVFSGWMDNALLLNAAGQVAFQASLQGGTSTIANDNGLWVGTPGSMMLVMREGDVVPGTGGSTASVLNGLSNYFNDQGQLLFNVTLAGGTYTGSALFAWDAAHGLLPVVLPGEMIEVRPGVFLPEQSFSCVQFNNTGGASLGFAHDGTIGLRIGLVGGTNAQMICHLPSISVGTPFCFGDGSGTACPCGNMGGAGNGCASSVNASGARLAATGVASLSSDSLHLSGTGLANTSGLYFQGTTRAAGGAGSVFGDGLRCAGGSVVRLGTKVASGGASQYPLPGDPSVSVRGSVTAPGTRTYQLWYRNAAAFCTPSTFNLTNGLEVIWAI